MTLSTPLNSTRYQAVANIANFLEDHFTPDQFTFMDGGTTLEIYSDALTECRNSPNWQALEQQYTAMGGSIYCPDDVKTSSTAETNGR